MKNSSVRTLITATAVTVIMSYGMNVSAQAPGGQTQQPQQPSSQQPSSQQPPRTTPPSQPSTPSTSQSQTSASSPIQGELLEVDTAKMTLTIMNEKNSKETFTYTNMTQVNNAAVAGLATMKNAHVTVHFTEKSGVKTATRIEVRPQSSASSPTSSPSTRPPSGQPNNPPSGQPQNPPTTPR